MGALTTRANRQSAARASSALAEKKRLPAGDVDSGPATRRLAGGSKQRELTADYKQRRLLT